ncbi:DUF1287 domain-containing protein [Methylomonas methanica]|uniref:DUF1287 domain-containing protein n=1 Tax=Methylomonas methanica (strain DSM 25384 / MC09) TaxID=857087 RepID=F9ZZA4_METMM|nr:DUF1287 domain-containing protein [Methylomonas methanica]AEG01130.1 protein of unknown function DUF1287 [Methylomonas methanica MC09]
MRVRFLLIATLVFSQNALAASFEQDIVSAAIAQTHHAVRYDGSYFSIAYPNGDVPENVGVCTDVVIRAYRKLGVDLQVLVHEDMLKNFRLYPSRKLWGLNATDRNIDHRRVPNLQVFFARHGKTLPMTDQGRDYAPGDVVTWMLPGNLPHIGIVTNMIASVSGNPMIVHNIGAGPKLEDMLLSYKITGHYRYVPKTYTGAP